MHIFNVYILMSLDIYTNPWYHHSVVTCFKRRNNVLGFFLIFYLFFPTGSLLRQERSSISVAVCGGVFSWSMWTLSCCMWDPAPWPGFEPGPQHWECRVPATELPENPNALIFRARIYCSSLWANQLGQGLGRASSIRFCAWMHSLPILQSLPLG